MRKFAAIFLAVLSLFLSQEITAVAAPNSVSLTFHYQRPAGDYDGWNLWLWKNVADNKKDVSISPTGVQFNSMDDFGKVLKIQISDMSAFENLGFIIRYKEWANRDTNDDRYITNFDSSGNAEVWLVQGDKKVYTALPVVVPQINSATIDGFRKITVELNKKLKLTGSGNEGFSLPSGPTVVSAKAIDGDALGATKIELTLSADVVIGTSYAISHIIFGTGSAMTGNIMNSADFNAKFTYTGNDLGNSYSKSETKFRVWAPTAKAVSIVTYASASALESTGVEKAMSPSENGTWITSLSGDQNGLIYNYRVSVNGGVNEAVDPYVRATIINGDRGVVLDLSKTNPANWKTTKPKFSGVGSDAIIYELHIRDLSADISGQFPAEHRGKYLALTDQNITSSSGGLAGLAAIKDLGVTHVQLQPFFDYASVDEANPTFNWGYDPENYNVPEGSYSSDPTNPIKRITELKSAIQALHDNGLSIMMDTVYNHVYDAGNFSQEKIVPGYFFRTNLDGSYTNGSGCGNDVASERPMVRKFIIDSVKYWATEYNIDGFRFDLMGLIDLTTMTQARDAIKKINPTALIIGEGWDMGTLPDAVKSNQKNIAKLDGVAVFNDQIRDGIKGSVFNGEEPGYVNGSSVGKETAIRTGVVGNIFYSKEFTNAWTAKNPAQSVNYVEAHDNLTLADKLVATMPTAKPAQLIQIHRFATSIALLAQGIPFMQAGQEFRRSKNGDSNSYKSSDEINSLKWNLRTTNKATVDYFKGLISLRKAHPAFRMATAAQVKSNLKFLDIGNNVVAYSINGGAVKDTWKSIVVIHNPNLVAMKIKLPKKTNWSVVVDAAKSGVSTLRTLKSTNMVSIPPSSTLVLHS